ncbi:MAG: CidA/LrgA family protein [Muribaculaceae bacterium]|nr:CidA/LrgA family protein [Muribaculaceae bacterium]
MKLKDFMGLLFFMNYLLQFGVLFAFLAAGEFVVWLTGIPVPSSIIGMLLLTASLKAGIVKPAHVERLSNFLVHNLGFFFVPAGVGLMNCLGIIADQWLPIVGASVGSTIIIIAVTGRTHRSVRRLLSRKKTAAYGLSEE